MTTSVLNSAEALKDLNQIKQVLNETTYRVNKLYLFFYGVLTIYLIPIILSLSIIYFPMSNDIRIHLLMAQGYFNLFFPFLLIPLFIIIKFKILPKSNRFAHKLLHIWMYGFMIIFFGATLIQIRFSYFIQTYISSSSNLEVDDFNIINDIKLGFDYMNPFLISLVLLFIYLIMNLITNKKGFLIGFFVNLIAYGAVIWVLPSSPIIINELLEMNLLDTIIHHIISSADELLLIINLLVMGTYFKNMYRMEQHAYENQ